MKDEDQTYYDGLVAQGHACSIGMGALGFEPRSAGIFYFRGPVTAISGRDGSALQSFFIDICIPLVIIPVQLEPAVLPGYTIPPRDGQTTDLRYIKRAVRPLRMRAHCFCWRRARLRRRSFFFRHFHRCLPCFFHAREPLFMVNEPAIDHLYMSTSSSAV